jgi:VWFA-related protein
MKIQNVLALMLMLSLLTNAFAQGRQPASPLAATDTQDDDEVVKITTNLVQVDAVVTDRSGKIVTDLAPSDFQILEDGRPQQITNFSFVTAAPFDGAENRATAAAPKGESVAPGAPTPPRRLRHEQVRRTIALVVDDLGLSFESMHFVRQALRKFVAEQMQDGDLVAIIRTGAGVGALQQFTADKQVLSAAIDRIKWNIRGRAGVTAFAAIEDDPLANFSNSRPQVSGGSNSSRAPQNSPSNQSSEREAKEKAAGFKDEIFAVGTLGAVNYVIRGLKELPGRKSVVLMSDSMPLFSPGSSVNHRLLEAMNQLTDLANRASVVVYTIDARGLQTLLPTAQDNLTGIKKLPNGTKVSGLSAPAAEMRASQRFQEFIQSQDGLNYLAAQTGGFFVNNTNDMNQGLRRVLEDQKGYYLLGYRPDEATFDDRTGRKRFHRLDVRVTRPGLYVRTRTGFYGISDEEARPVRNNRSEQLLAALTSPFASADVNLRLTSLFLNDAVTGPFMRSLIYVDARSLTFTREPDGSRKANVELVAVTFGEDGGIVDQRLRAESVVVREGEYEQVLRNGLVFGINLPVKKSGAYQLRVAVRDAATERVGSAGQFIEVPELKKNRLTLSGIYLASNQQMSGMTGKQAGAQAAPASLKDGALDSESGPAVRRFSAGTVIDYGFEVYNAKLDKATGRTRLQTQVRLFRDNRLVYAGKVIPIAGEAADAKRVSAIGHLQLGSNLAPGEYILQVVVTDLLGKEKQQAAQQWMDFEIK